MRLMDAKETVDLLLHRGLQITLSSDHSDWLFEISTEPLLN